MRLTDSKQFKLTSETEWNSVVLYLAPFFQGRTLLLIDGEMGAGKTTFTKYLSKYFDIPQISSPTYAIMQKYNVDQSVNQSDPSAVNSILHVDLYRLENSDEVNASGFWDMLNAAELANDQLVVVEWANRIENNEWPLNWNIAKINILKKNVNERLVDIKLLFQK